MWAYLNNWIRPIKPKTLGGRISVILLMAGITIAALSAGASFYFTNLNKKYAQSYNLGVDIYQYLSELQIKDKPSFEIPVSILEISADVPSEALIQQSIKVPDHLIDEIRYIKITLLFKEGSLAPEQILHIQQAPGSAHFWGQLSTEITRQGRETSILLQFSNGEQLTLHSPEFWQERLVPAAVFLLFFAGFVACLLFYSFTANLLAGPFVNLTRIIQEQGKKRKVTLAEERGPIEAREMARAYNAIRQQIMQMLDGRTRMLAAISHDLRTPGTRLRLRAEFVEDDELREEILKDLDEMDGLLNEVLDFLNDNNQKEEKKNVIFLSLLESICDDYIDLGRPVTYNGLKPLNFEQVTTVFGKQESETKFFADERKIQISCRPDTLRRAITNLIDNALKYGGCAVIDVDATPKDITITIADKGPGIPEEEMDNVFLPFFRLETSRGRQTGGSGLGLAIVKTIIEAHNGDIDLSNHPKQGLIISVRLPREWQPMTNTAD
ncbi:sensor histidine kinase [Curvivirga sp.]|uniref:sensor histidine kinase n=1 Tax=Curvivirga sp. TaxID=2856848 RepID=UPI003B5C4CC6